MESTNQNAASTAPKVSALLPQKGVLGKKALHKLLKKHESLKEKRNPMFERNRFVKFLMYFMLLYYAGCLVMLGVTMPMPLSQVYSGVAGYHVLDGWFFFIPIADFWLRFIVQDTPANLVRPYSLLPISRKFLMRRYMVRAGLTWGNLFWFFFILPFTIVSLMGTMRVYEGLGWMLGWWLIIVANSYMYLLVRALCTRHMAWILAPIALHAAILLMAFLPSHSWMDMPCTHFMGGFASWNPLCFLGVLAVIALFFYLNTYVQSLIIYDEVGKKEEVEMKHASKMSWLNRFGIVGEYLKLELKMKMRNRTPKLQFFTLLGCMLLLSALLYFTDIYDGAFMTSFICMYDYLVPGMATLVTIMCHEGNYMDVLMSRKESILDLLYAKYYFNAALLLLPFCLLIPLTVSGKISILMNLGYLFFTIGVLYPAMFQMAAYNKETLPLNAKLASKQGNGAQNIVTMAIMFVPILLERLSVTLLGSVWGYAVLIVVGGIGIVTHRIWLRFTYKRFMQKRYKNMEGFRATRK